MPPRIEPNIEKEIIHRYLNLKCKTSEIAELFKLSERTIRSIIKRNGHEIRRGGRKHFYDSQFFNKIETEAQAYFLGLLYADGYNDTDNNTVSLSLQERDEEILNKFNECIKSNRPLLLLNRSKYNTKWQNQKRLYITDKQISQDLEKLGCMKAKSLVVNFPSVNQVPLNLISHFMRGYLDGDGSIIVYVRNDRNTWTTTVSFSVSESFAIGLKNFLKNILNINAIITQPKNNKIKTITVAGRNQTLLLLDWIYKDASIYLERKYVKYLEAKEKTGLKFFPVGNQHLNNQLVDPHLF